MDTHRAILAAFLVCVIVISLWALFSCGPADENSCDVRTDCGGFWPSDHITIFHIGKMPCVKYTTNTGAGIDCDWSKWEE